MNDRRDHKKSHALVILCACLAALAVGLGAWAITAQLRVNRLNARLQAQEEGANAGTQSPAQEGSALDYDPTTVVAEFEGGTITAGEAMAEYETLASYYEALGVDASEYEQDAKETALRNLAEQKILALKAQELGLGELTEAERAEIEARAASDFEENVRYYMSFRTDDGESEEDARAETIAYLAESDYTLETAVEEALQDAAQQRLYDYVTADLNVSDEQLQSFYEEQLENAELTYTADFTEYEADIETGRAVVWNPEGVRRVQSILIPFSEEQSVEYLSLSAAADVGDDSDAAALQALYAALEPAAQEVLDRLHAGESFESLMAEYGSYGSTEGSCVSAQSSFHGDAFRDAGLALKEIGDISDIVQTDGGLCILRYAADVTPGPVPYAEVAEGLRTDYEEELKLSLYNTTVAQWIADANVQYYPDRLG